MKNKILVICGSLRKNSHNAIIADALAGLAPEGLSLERLPVIDQMPLYNADVQAEGGFPDVVLDVADAIRDASGIIIVSPEYNFSVPGGLKNLLDWLSRVQPQPFAGKPVAIQSASPGPVGGARMQYHLRQILVFLDAFVMNKPEIMIGNVASRLNEATREITDETTRNLITQQLSAFATFVERRGS